MLHERSLSLVLALAVVIAAAVACSSEVTPGELHGRGVYIPEQWQTTRTVDGHHTHVVTEKIACNNCHALTDTEIGPVVPAKCAKCHEREGKLSHAAEKARDTFGPAATTDCISCHAFNVELPKDAAHTGPVHPYSPSDCARCHMVDQGDVPAVTVHQTQGCVTCHKPHEQEHPVSAPCNECHQSVSTTHASAGKDVVATCTTCHANQHAPASDALGTCAPCHAQQDPKIPATALFEGHTECQGCHRPHEFEKSQAVVCQNCHEGMLVLGGARAKPHNDCTNCHNPHDVKAASATACARCHTDISPNHPKHGNVGSCTGCHDPHPNSAHAKDRVRNCSSCHQQAAHDTDLHRGVGCRECHQPHDFLLADKGVTLCANCHEENVEHATSLKGHSTCANCHRGLPHRPEALQAKCQSCHQQQNGEVNKGHGDCQSCHEPHAGSIQKECKSCHSDVHASAPKGHQACTGCHQPHSGSTAQNPCSECHAQVADSPHGKLSQKCNDCHRPHGPAGAPGAARPPACGSCHQPASLQGLHTVAQHADCKRCHTEHGEKQAERPRCLGCHTDRAEHFPDAPACVSCHLFVKTR